jgi:hypothetical protein
MADLTDAVNEILVEKLRSEEDNALLAGMSFF